MLFTILKRLFNLGRQEQPSEGVPPPPLIEELNPRYSVVIFRSFTASSRGGTKKGSPFLPLDRAICINNKALTSFCHKIIF